MNNRFQKIILLSLIILLVYSCAVFDVSYSKNPRKVAEKFLHQMYSGNYKKAKKLGTHKTGQILDMLDQLVVISGQTGFTQNQKVEMLDCKVAGDSAQCNYLLNGKNNVIDLVRQDNKWLVDLKKEAKNKTEKNKFLEERKSNGKDNKK
jgi:hypothetical protein